MGSGGTTQLAQPQIPEELKGLMSGSANAALGAQNLNPLSLFTTPNPQQIAPLSNLQNAGLEGIGTLPGAGQAAYHAAFGNLATAPELYGLPIGTPGAENQALGQLGQLTGGEIGSSPATQAGMRAWQSSVLPQVQNQMSQAGLGRGGDLLKAVGGSASEAFFPLIQQEVQNRMGSVPLYNQIGQQQQERGRRPIEQMAGSFERAAPILSQMSQQQFDQRKQSIETALAGGKLTQDQAQKGLDALKNEQDRLQALSEATSLGPLGQLGSSLIGSKSTTKSPLGMIGAILGK